ncbi:hypothetical protein [Natronococcus pandeyae]|nr:hypothetical protein [Natronococcus pandeyae]
MDIKERLIATFDPWYEERIMRELEEEAEAEDAGERPEDQQQEEV